MELLAPGGARDGRERSGAGDGDDDAGGFPEALPRAGETKQKQTFFRFSSNDACPPSASATLLCCVAALQASGRVDGELFDTARSALFTSASALECPRDAARAVGALASAAPERAAALLRDATTRTRVFLSTHQSAFSANKGHLDPADHASARLSARVAAVLVAEADAFELGLPVRDVADAARAAFALATLTLPKRTTKMDAEDVSNETIFRREKNENDALSITRAFAWETVASALAFFAANRDLFARDKASIRNSRRDVSGLDVAAVRDALAEALDPLGLIAAVAETESEKEKAAEKEKASRAASATSAASRLASLSMFSPSKKRGSAAEPSATTTRNANAKKNVAGSSSYGSATADSHSPASSLPGSPRRNGGHSRSDSSLSRSAESAHSMKNAWAPAAELRLRAAAADAVAPFALFSRSENGGDVETARRDALPLLRDALSCACHPVPVLGSSWPADPETANAAATLRLRALEAFIAAPAFMFDSAERRVDDRDASLGAFDAAVGACAALPESDLPLPNADHSDHSDHSTYVSSSPEHFLRRALNPADAPLGPWHGEESDAASGSLRRFEGAADAPPTSPWRLSCRPNSSSEPFFLREEDTGFAAGLGATLRFARARALARVAAESPARAPAVLAATAAEAAAAANGEDAFSSGSVFFAAGPAPAAGNPRDLLSPKPFSSADDSLSGGAVTTSDRPASPLGSPAKRANGRHRRAPSGGGGSGGLFALPGSMGGSAKAEEKRKLDAATRAERAASSLTSACVASLAVAEAMAASFERKRSSHARRRDGDADEKDATDVAKRKETVFRNLRLETASSLAEVAAAVSGSRFAGAAHWRAAAELEAAAASIRDDAAAAADALRARAAELASLPVTRGGSHGGSSDASTKAVQKHRAAACAACASSFRRAGALAMAAATRPLASALASAAAELDGTPFFSEASHLWAAHALSVVAAHAGPAFEKRAPATLELAFALLNSPEANDVVDGDVRLDARPTETEETRSKERSGNVVNASRAASSLRAACGRLVNSAVAAVGPELDAVSPAAASFFAFASALMDAVSDGGEGGATGAGAYAAFARSGAEGSLSETESSTARSAFTSFRLSDAGDAACRHEAATYVQQLALFAPRVATPARLVPRLRASLASGRPTLRRAAAQTLKHLCERDAGAVARAAAANGGGLEGDLLRFVDQRGDGDGDPVAATHAKRALRLLTRNASLRVSPVSAMKTLAAVALWTPGGGARADDAGFQSEEGENRSKENHVVSVSGHERNGFRASGAPKLATRVLAAALIAEAPTAAAAASASGVGDFAYDVVVLHNSHATMSVADARAAVDCAYRLATAPAAALRPAGLRALRATLASLRGREDPDASFSSNGTYDGASLFATQFQAQTLSALRAAREPDASPRCFVEGAHLAATAAACGLDAGDPRAARLIRAFVFEPLDAWLDEEEATTKTFFFRPDADADETTSCDSSDEQTLETVSSPLTRRASASCAEGIVARLRVAALVSSARLYLLDETTASDEPVSAKPTYTPRLSLATRWAAAAADFAAALVHGADESDSVVSGERDANANANAKRSSGALPEALETFPLSIVPASLREKSAVAEDLADAWGPCLDAATSVLFAETRPETFLKDEALTTRSFALVASALAAAQLVGSLRLVSAGDDEGPDAALAKPLNPNADRVFGFWKTSQKKHDGSSPFAVARGRPLDGRAALAARCLARVAAWTFRTAAEEDVPLRRAVSEACAAAVTALDAGVGVDVRATTAEARGSAAAGKEREKTSSFAAEARALGLVLAAHAADADAAASAAALAAGLARRPERFCVAAAAEMVVAMLDDSRRESSASATTTRLLLLTAVRTLLETPQETSGEKEGSPSPFVAPFASLVRRADAETATTAKRALFSDASLFLKSEDVVAALAAASVDELFCVSTRDTSVSPNAFVSTREPCANRKQERVALEALAAFFSDDAKRASRRRARGEAAAFKELRRRFSYSETKNEDVNDDARRHLPTFLRSFGAACASATLRRLRLCASSRRVSASRREDVVAAAEGLKFWVAATEALGKKRHEDDDDVFFSDKNVVARQTATVAAFLPLALEAMLPSSFLEEEEEEEEEEGEEEASFRAQKTREEDDDAAAEASSRALASAAKTMATSLAGAAPSAFRAAVAALRPESTARLRAAMARDTVRDTSEHPRGYRARSSAGDRTSTPLPPPPPSFAAFAAFASSAPNDR